METKILITITIIKIHFYYETVIPRNVNISQQLKANIVTADFSQESWQFFEALYVAVVIRHF